MSDKEKETVKYINKILKAQVSPVKKGELMEESKKNTYGYMMRLIRMMGTHPHRDIVQCKIQMKNDLIKINDDRKNIDRKK